MRINKKFLLLLTIFLLSIVTYVVLKSLQFKLAPELTLSIPFLGKDSNTISIALIGDSWVADHRLDTIIKKTIVVGNKEIKVNSSGQYGARSKDVYLNIFKASNESNSLQQIILSKPDYCFISAGNNDLNMGTKFYVHHMMLIIKFLCKVGIKPIVMLLPNYEKNIPQISTIEKVSRYFRNFFSKSEYNIDATVYNYNLINEISKNQLNAKVILIDKNYNDSLKIYVNYTKQQFKTFHLNNIGNYLLAKEIAKKITEDIRIAKFKN
jgi:hypothetical protein